MFFDFTPLFLSVVLVGSAAPAPDSPGLPRDHLARQQGFATVVVNHVSDALGTEQLPRGAGVPIEPGMFSTILPDRLQIYDHDVVSLVQGEVGDVAAAPECVSGCPAGLFDAFQEAWLKAAVESTVHSVEIPQRVLIASHADTPAKTLLQVSYAAAETRPVAPPSLDLLVASERGGIRSLRYYLIPPEGLDLPQGSAALGLTITMARGRYVIGATDPGFPREQTANGPEALRRVLAEIKKRYPGKATVIVVPDAEISVGELVRAYAAVQSMFPRLVLSAGQRVSTP